MAAKLKFGFYWAASCGGCEVAVLDTNERILDVIERADIVLWPVAIDTKYEHVRAMTEGFMDVCFLNGSVRNSEQEDLAHLLRSKSKTLVAFGSCAQHGCIPGLANMYRRGQILDTVYRNGPSVSNPEQVLPRTRSRQPEGELTLPELHDHVRPIDRVVPVDYYLPGCPPPVALILDAMSAVFEGRLPRPGTVLCSGKALCDDCERNKHNVRKMTDVKRVYEAVLDPGICFLEQGVICMGPVTRTGCGRRCINGNWPCTGCMGPTSEVTDQGGRMVSALAAILGCDDEARFTDEEVGRLMAGVKDPVGTFYMYGLASATINQARRL